MISVYWHHSDGYWDCALPRFLFDRVLERPYFSQQGKSRYVLLPPNCDTEILVIPGRHSCDDYDLLNERAAHFKKVIFFIIGDEEGIWHSDRLQHPNMRIWWAMPPFAPKQKVDRVCINGWPTAAIDMIIDAKEKTNGDRILDWSFLGQMTHIRRVMCIDALQGIPNGQMLPTNGFTQGVPREEYYRTMVMSKVIPCPSGPCTPDSFRFAEALLAGCIPIADDLIQHDWYPSGYFRYALAEEDLPFPLISDWSTLPEVMAKCLENWHKQSAACSKWFAGYLNKLTGWLKEDLEA